jgi:hypothetical protein
MPCTRFKGIRCTRFRQLRKIFFFLKGLKIFSVGVLKITLVWFCRTPFFFFLQPSVAWTLVEPFNLVQGLLSLEKKKEYFSLASCNRPSGPENTKNTCTRFMSASLKNF